MPIFRLRKVFQFDNVLHFLFSVAKETLEGHQRAIMGTMSVEEIYRDRKKFSSSVFNVASTDLVNMGIMVISYTIKEITDDVGYLKALGKTIFLMFSCQISNVYDRLTHLFLKIRY